MTLAFLASEFSPTPPQQARFHIIPAPMEQSVSYGAGTAHGPQAILAASQQLEAWDGRTSPGDCGIYTRTAVDCGGTPEDALARIEAAVRESLHANASAVPVLLGGEHTATLGALRALAAQAGLTEKSANAPMTAKSAHAAAPFGIIQFDAHADLRASYEGSIYSHACVMHRAVADLGLPLAQFGVREMCRAEALTRQEHNVIHYDAAILARDGLPAHPLPDDFPQRVYVSFDVDALDAAIMPATGTPSPGGLGWYDALALVERCLHGRTLIGMDVMEFAPLPQLHFADFTAAKLVYALMGAAQHAGALR